MQQQTIDMPELDRLSAGDFIIPSPAQLRKIKTEDPLVLAEFGIADPAPTGWRSYLNGIWHWEGGIVHDTVFDEKFRAKWLRIESGVRVPLENPRASSSLGSDHAV